MNSLKHSFFYARRTSECTHRRYLYSQLGPGALTAHRSVRLVLLHSCPDTVHEVLLRKTQTSTPLTRGSPARTYPRRDITPAGADCRFRAPLSPRLRGSFMTILRQLSIPYRHSFVKISIAEMPVPMLNWPLKTQIDTDTHHLL